MPDTENIENEEKGKSSGPAKIVLIVLGVIALVFVLGVLFFAFTFKKYFGGYVVDSINSQTNECCKAITCQIEDYYNAMGKEVPSDKEYIVRATLDRNGLVNESCELLPESERNQHFGGVSNVKKYIAVKYKPGNHREAWLAEKPLTDEMLREYARDEQQEMYRENVWNGEKNTVGYINSDKPTEYYH